MRITLLACVSGLLIAGSLPLAGAALADAPTPMRQTVIRVDGREVTNIGLWTEKTRKENRPPDLWRYYMHGVVDHFATPIAWEGIFGPGQNMTEWLDNDAPIDTPYKKSGLPAIRLNLRGKSLEFALKKPLPIDLPPLQGRWIRIHMWIKGKLDGYPNIWITFKDAGGKTLTRHQASVPKLWRTDGEFPWHCYYSDWFVPTGAAGMFLAFEAYYTGVARFSTLSWEPVTSDNTYRWNEVQDPFTGSSSPNPIYDRTSFVISYFGGKYKWAFLKGKEAGLVGQPYDLTTKEGFRQYYEAAKVSPFSDDLHIGVRDLPRTMQYGLKNNLLPSPLEDGWMENYVAVLEADQDPKTGFWCVRPGNPSLGLTFHWTNDNFCYYGIRRPDHADIVTPDIVGKKVPNAEKVVKSVLATQSSYTDENGVKRKAAWCDAAYGYTETPDAFKDKCYMGSTMDAVYLVRLAARDVGEELNRDVYDSVKAAVRYVLRKCVQEDGAWKQSDTAPGPTTPAYLMGTLSWSSYLERRVNPTYPAPRVSAVAKDDGSCLFTWSQPVGEQNSVRIYAAPNSVPTEKINEAFLVGVIHRTGHAVYEMDPFLATDKMIKAGSKRWGKYGGPNTWSPQHRYFNLKLNMIVHPLASSNDGQPLALRMDLIKDKSLYVSAADWYGEESAPVPVSVQTK